MNEARRLERDAALSLRGVTKRFGASTALREVDLVVRPGTVHALLGENGAGKTTLMRVAYGMTSPDAGTIEVAGRRVVFASPADAIAAGVGMVHQHFTLVPAMTVAENVALGGRGGYSARSAARIVAEVGALTGFALDPGALVSTLPVGAQQRVEIAKALARRATLLVLDEPTGVLAPAETEELLRWLRDFVARGNSAVLITHKLREALAVADDVTVLRRGARVWHGRAADTSEEALAIAMIGESLPSRGHGPTATASAGAPVMFRAEELSAGDGAGTGGIRAASFTIAAGELVGVVGVEGSGQRELLRALAGRLQPSRGVLRRPEAIGFVPEDRHRDAVLLERSLVENVALRGAGKARGVMDWGAMRRRTAALMERFDVRAGGAELPVRALSGGNQQKLVLARELASWEPEHHPDAPARAEPAHAAIVVENPTRGLDIRASAAVHDQLRLAAARGAAVVLYSSDLDEVLALATRVLVVFDGGVRDMAPDRAAIARAMVGLQ